MANEHTVVLMIDSDAASVEAVKEAFVATEGGLRIENTDLLAAGLERVAAGGIDIILLSLHLPDAEGFEVLERTLRQAGETPIIVLGEQEDAELALRTVRAGAQDYLVKGRVPGPSLVRCVWHAVERNRRTRTLLAGTRPPGGGKVVTFLGVKGGVGTTTTVLNVAAALSAQGKQTIAAELWPFSNLAIHLRRGRTPDIGPLLDADADRIDSQAVEEKLVSLPFGFRALFAAARATGGRVIEPDHARALLQSAKQLADFVLVDLPALISPLHPAVASSSDFVAVVVEPDPLSVEFAKSVTQMLARWDVSAFALLVINRAALSNSLRPQDVKSRVGCELVGVVPSAGEACLLAYGAGKLLFTAQPESRFSLGIQSLADNLAQNPVATLS